MQRKQGRNERKSLSLCEIMLPHYICKVCYDTAKIRKI